MHGRRLGAVIKGHRFAAGQIADQRARHQFDHGRQGRALMPAEGQHGAVQSGARIRRRLTLGVDAPALGDRLAGDVVQRHVPARDGAGGKVEHERVGARTRPAERDGVGAEHRLAAPGRRHPGMAGVARQRHQAGLGVTGVGAHQGGRGVGDDRLGVQRHLARADGHHTAGETIKPVRGALVPLARRDGPRHRLGVRNGQSRPRQHPSRQGEHLVDRQGDRFLGLKHAHIALPQHNRIRYGRRRKLQAVWRPFFRARRGPRSDQSGNGSAPRRVAPHRAGAAGRTGEPGRRDPVPPLGTPHPEDARRGRRRADRPGLPDRPAVLPRPSRPRVSVPRRKRPGWRRATADSGGSPERRAPARPDCRGPDHPSPRDPPTARERAGTGHWAWARAGSPWPPCEPTRR
uniref:LigA n=1 Tax=Parastrongyloides trichosuri TaxID=131310 RepID=A0A0N4ZGD2_PARTI